MDDFLPTIEQANALVKEHAQRAKEAQANYEEVSLQDAATYLVTMIKNVSPSVNAVSIPREVFFGPYIPGQFAMLVQALCALGFTATYEMADNNMEHINLTNISYGNNVAGLISDIPFKNPFPAGFDAKYMETLKAERIAEAKELVRLRVKHAFDTISSRKFEETGKAIAVSLVPNKNETKLHKAWLCVGARALLPTIQERFSAEVIEESEDCSAQLKIWWD